MCATLAIDYSKVVAGCKKRAQQLRRKHEQTRVERLRNRPTVLRRPTDGADAIVLTSVRT